MFLRFGVVIPTFNAGAHLEPLIESLRTQSAVPEKVLFIDSSSSDGTPERLKRTPWQVLSISSTEFNHGATRQLGADRLDGAEVAVFLTQDAYLADPLALKRLLAPFESPSVGAAFGRQVPHRGAGPIGAHARLFNYPKASSRRSSADISRLGLRTAFISNSFAAYRIAALERIGGFPANVIFGEDMVAAARMVLAGYEISYQADATVFHSHDYRIWEEFRRYFDVGVLHAREGWLLEKFSSPYGEARRFLRSEIEFLLREAPYLVPVGLFRTMVKFVAYRLGRTEKMIPARVKARLSMNSGYWGA